jgi:hypothetical protein
MKRILRSFWLIINYKTFILTVLSVISTYVSYHHGLNAWFPDMLVEVAIVFPFVFFLSVQPITGGSLPCSACRILKVHAIAIYYAMRDWPVECADDLPRKIRGMVEEITLLMRTMFLSTARHHWQENEKRIYQLFSRLSVLTMDLRKQDVQSSEISRVSQYISKMIIAFDNLKIIHAYRNPVTLRAYSKVFIYFFPIIYGPYSASTFHDYSAHLKYVMPVLYSFILVSLDNIQDHLEHLF